VADVLSQNEIESLLRSLSSDGTDANAQAQVQVGQRSGPGIQSLGDLDQFDTFVGNSKIASKNAVAYEVYDFRRPDKFSKDQLRTLQMLHETFARLAGTGLSAMLRSPVSIDMISLEQVPYEEYLRSINNSVFTVMSMPPLAGQAVVEMEFQLIFTMVDRLLGGPGRGINRTVLTDIEKPLVRQMIERMFSSLKAAWEGISVINPGIETMETSSQFVQIAPPSDIVVTILFEVKIGNSRGAMSICIPYLVLKPVTARLSAQKWFVNNNKKDRGSARRILAAQVSGAKVDCTIKLGRSRINVKDFLQLNAGDVLRLEQRHEDPLVMEVAKTPKYQVKPALEGSRLMFHVVDFIEPE
jgi:flagellar motor switch protein FliM